MKIERQQKFPQGSPDPLIPTSETFTFADSVYALGSPAAASDKNGKIHVLWSEVDANNSIQLRYMQGSGGKFQGATIDTIGKVTGSPGYFEGDILNYQPAICIDKNMKLHVAYNKIVNGDVQIWYASIDILKGTFQKQVIDTGLGFRPVFRAGILSDSSGVVHIAYKKQGIWHAQVSGASIGKTPVAKNKDESPQQEHGLDLALLVDSNNTLLIPSHGLLTRGAAYAFLGEFINYGIKANAGPWQFKELYYAGAGTTQGKSISGTYDINGNPLFLYRSPNRQLGLARWVQNAWQRETITLPYPTDSNFMLQVTGNKEGLLLSWTTEDGYVAVSTLHNSVWKHKKSVVWKAVYGDVACPVISPDGIELWLRNADASGKLRLVRLLSSSKTIASF